MEQQNIPRWLVLARKELGTAEIEGPQHNPRVLSYFKLAGHAGISDDETPWCAAFACAMLELSYVDSPRTLTAREFLNWGVSVTRPSPGDIVVFRRGNSSWEGHVGFFEEWSKDGQHILVLGGNQKNSVCQLWFPVTALLGFRRPMQEQPVSTHPPAQFSTPPPLPIAPTPPVFPVFNYQTRDDVAARLRAEGSRTMANADKTEARSKWIAIGGFGAIVTSVMNFFTDLYQTLSPLAPVIGLGVLGALALCLAMYSVYDQKRIKDARVEDHVNGLHCGIGGCEKT